MPINIYACGQTSNIENIDPHDIVIGNAMIHFIDVKPDMKVDEIIGKVRYMKDHHSEYEALHLNLDASNIFSLELRGHAKVSFKKDDAIVNIESPSQFGLTWYRLTITPR